MILKCFELNLSTTLFATPSMSLHETTQSVSAVPSSLERLVLGNEMLEWFYGVLYAFMFVFGLSCNALLHLLLMQLHRQGLFEDLTPLLLLINLMDSGAVLFGLPYHMAKLVIIKVDLRALDVWLCRSHMFIVNVFMDVAISLRLLLCISQVSAVFPKLRAGAFWHLIASSARVGIAVVVAVVLLKTAVESLFHEVVWFKIAKAKVCLNKDQEMMLIFTIISSGFILLTYPTIAVCNFLFLLRIKARSRFRRALNPRSNRRLIAAQELAPSSPLPRSEESTQNNTSKETSKLCLLSSCNIELQESLSEKQPQTLAPPPIQTLVHHTILPSSITNKKLELNAKQSPDSQIMSLSRNGSQKSNTDCENKGGCQEGVARSSDRRVRRRSALRPSSMLPSIMITNLFFVLCYLPHFAMSMWGFMTEIMQKPNTASATEVEQLLRAYQATVSLAYLFHTLDTLVYALSYRSLRDQLRLFIFRLAPARNEPTQESLPQ